MVIRFDDVVINPEAHELRRSGDLIEVQPQVLSVLLYLIEHRDRVVSKEEILDAVWQHRFVTESALTSRIKTARQAIGDNGSDQRMIRTVHGRGYRFVAELATLDDAASPASSSHLVVASPLGGASPRRVRLPAQSTPFVGRHRELSDLARLLGEPDCRLLTIVGPGGMGKTRLAVAVADQLAERYADGVAFVPLASVTDADEMVHAIADALDLPLDAGNEPSAQVLAHLSNKRMLLLLDNVEHLPDVSFIGDLVATTSSVQAISTSREQLRLRAEWTFELGGMWTGLGAGDGDDTAADAIELFVASARRVQPDFALAGDDGEVVRDLCRMVGGMPLAIELAAGWSRMLTVGEIAVELERGLELLETELRDVPERHRRIRTVLEGTWDRLDADARAVFMQLSVFRGGFTRAAAEIVAGARLPMLRRLAATSMLMATADDRYLVHELLRQYGEQRLDESGGRDEARRRHSDYYLGWLSDQARGLRGGAQLDAIESISLEIGNVRAAWSDAVRHRRTDTSGRTIEALWLFADARGNAGELGQLIRLAPTTTPTTIDGPIESSALVRCAHGLVLAHRGLLEEGRDILSQVVSELESADGDQPPQEAMSLAHLWHGWVSFLLARNDEADEHAREALSAYSILGDRWGIARCHYLLGNNDTALGRLSTAEEMLHVSRSIAEEIDDRRGVALASRNLAIIAGWFGRYSEARALLERAASISREFDDRLGTAYTLRELGKVNTAEGRVSDAIEVLRRSIAITDEIENRWESAATANDLGNALTAAGDLDAAEQALRACLGAAEATAHHYYAARCVGDLGVLAHRRGEDERAVELLDDALDRWRQVGHEPYAAWALARLGEVAAHRGDRSAAIRCYGEAVVLAERHGLAPVALDVVAGAAQLGLPEPAVLRASSLSVVAHHPATDSRTRQSARQLLEELGSGPPVDDPDQSTDDGERPTWREAAVAIAHLLTR